MLGHVRVAAKWTSRLRLLRRQVSFLLGGVGGHAEVVLPTDKLGTTLLRLQRSSRHFGLGLRIAVLTSGLAV